MKLDQISEMYLQMHAAANSQQLYEEVLMEDRIDYLKSKWPEINTSHDASAVHRKAGDVIDFMAGAIDPTKNKSYTQWLTHRYNSGAFRQEDAPRVKETLQDFEEKKHHLPAEQRDIGRYKKLSDVRDAVAPFAGKTGEDIQRERMASAQPDEEPGFVKHYEDPHIKVHELKDEKTSQRLFGRPRTEWCTAWEGNSCRFKNYVHEDEDKGPLFVVTRKKDNAVSSDNEPVHGQRR